MRMRVDNKFTKRSVSFSVLILFLLSMPGFVFAQAPGPPGGDQSPCDLNGGVTSGSTTCPLDTWVWVLVIGAAILGAIILSKKHKMEKAV